MLERHAQVCKERPIFKSDLPTFTIYFACGMSARHLAGPIEAQLDKFRCVIFSFVLNASPVVKDTSSKTFRWYTSLSCHISCHRKVNSTVSKLDRIRWN